MAPTNDATPRHAHAGATRENIGRCCCSKGSPPVIDRCWVDLGHFLTSCGFALRQLSRFIHGWTWYSAELWIVVRRRRRRADCAPSAWRAHEVDIAATPRSAENERSNHRVLDGAVFNDRPHGSAKHRHAESMVRARASAYASPRGLLAVCLPPNALSPTSRKRINRRSPSTA